MFIRVSVCLFVRVFTFEVPFKRFFATTSQCRMSKKNWDSESLRKNNGKKWCHIWKLLVIKGINRRAKKVCYGANFAWIRKLYNMDQEVMFSDAIIEPLQKTFAYKGCKITEKKAFLFCKFCLTSRIFLVSVLHAPYRRCIRSFKTLPGQHVPILSINCILSCP